MPGFCGERQNPAMMTLDEKRGYVRRFFSATGDSYDQIVSLCTFGVDRRWKRTIIERLDGPGRVLDLACGTGILSFAIARRYPACQVVGVDITADYLRRAREKLGGSGGSRLRFQEGWAEEFESDEPFDCIVSSYLAKYADLSRLVPKSSSMLKPGGLLLFHDFTYPKSPLLASVWELYFKLLQSVGGRFYPNWREVFFELPELIRRTSWVEDLMGLMRESGLVSIGAEALTLQGATLVSARKSRP